MRSAARRSLRSRLAAGKGSRGGVTHLEHFSPDDGLRHGRGEPVLASERVAEARPLQRSREAWVGAAGARELGARDLSPEAGVMEVVKVVDELAARELVSRSGPERPQHAAQLCAGVA